MAGNAPIEFITFHKNANVAEDGTIYSVSGNANILNIDLMTTKSGTDAVTFTANFEGKVSDESDWDSISAFNLNTLEVSTQATTTDTYQLDSTAWSYIRVRLSAVANGSVTVLCKAVG